MRSMTKEFLSTAFAGESQAHVKYMIFSEDCAKKGLKNLANLFKAISHAEFVHAKCHFIALKKLGETTENVKNALDGETYEIEEMYPVYNETAKFQKETDAVRTTFYALEAEKIHATMYQKALELANSKKDYPASKIQICELCGHTVENEAPDKCPVCGAKKDFYRAFSA
ncbi:MAG: rubrerythrin family protein [Candidatus Riflebacteria bacterium]|nr:rubrerythrin family protein [Candidatus Riflebacteria bacterium]